MWGMEDSYFHLTDAVMMDLYDSLPVITKRSAIMALATDIDHKMQGLRGRD